MQEVYADPQFSLHEIKRFIMEGKTQSALNILNSVKFSKEQHDQIIDETFHAGNHLIIDVYIKNGHQVTWDQIERSIYNSTLNLTLRLIADYPEEQLRFNLNNIDLQKLLDRIVFSYIDYKYDDTFVRCVEPGVETICSREGGYQADDILGTLKLLNMYQANIPKYNNTEFVKILEYVLTNRNGDLQRFSHKFASNELINQEIFLLFHEIEKLGFKFNCINDAGDCVANLLCGINVNDHLGEIIVASLINASLYDYPQMKTLVNHSGYSLVHSLANTKTESFAKILIQVFNLHDVPCDLHTKLKTPIEFFKTEAASEQNETNSFLINLHTSMFDYIEFKIEDPFSDKVLPTCMLNNLARLKLITSNGKMYGTQEFYEFLLCLDDLSQVQQVVVEKFFKSDLLANSPNLDLFVMALYRYLSTRELPEIFLQSSTCEHLIKSGYFDRIIVDDNTICTKIFSEYRQGSLKALLLHMPEKDINKKYRMAAKYNNSFMLSVGHIGLGTLEEEFKFELLQIALFNNSGTFARMIASLCSEESLGIYFSTKISLGIILTKIECNLLGKREIKKHEILQVLNLITAHANFEQRLFTLTSDLKLLIGLELIDSDIFLALVEKNKRILSYHLFLLTKDLLKLPGWETKPYASKYCDEVVKCFHKHSNMLSVKRDIKLIVKDLNQFMGDVYALKTQQYKKRIITAVLLSNLTGLNVDFKEERIKQELTNTLGCGYAARLGMDIISNQLYPANKELFDSIVTMQPNIINNIILKYDSRTIEAFANSLYGENILDLYLNYNREFSPELFHFIIGSNSRIAWQVIRYAVKRNCIDLVIALMTNNDFHTNIPEPYLIGEKLVNLALKYMRPNLLEYLLDINVYADSTQYSKVFNAELICDFVKRNLHHPIGDQERESTIVETICLISSRAIKLKFTLQQIIDMLISNDDFICHTDSLNNIRDFITRLDYHGKSLQDITNIDSDQNTLGHVLLLERWGSNYTYFKIFKVFIKQFPELVLVVNKDGYSLLQLALMQDDHDYKEELVKILAMNIDVRLVTPKGDAFTIATQFNSKDLLARAIGITIKPRTPCPQYQSSQFLVRQPQIDNVQATDSRRHEIDLLRKFSTLLTKRKQAENEEEQQENNNRFKI